MRLFLQRAGERARPRQSCVKIVDPEKQEEAVAGLGMTGTCQRGMIVGAPFVETEQDSSISVEDLTPFIVGRSRLRQAKQRLVPLVTPGNVCHADYRPYAFHGFLSIRAIATPESGGTRCSRPATNITDFRMLITTPTVFVKSFHAIFMDQDFIAATIT
jgi:hypothetical protein